MLSQLRAAVMTVVLFTLVLGLAYPLAMTGIATVALPHQAGGSLVRDASGKVIGSELIAQGFAKPEYLHPRPSAAGNGYDPMNSGGTNLGPMDQKLIDRIKADTATLRKENPNMAVPIDAVTTSASGLDPDISPEYARFQVPRIAKARGASESEVQAAIVGATQQPFLGFIGQARVNVLAVNRALDAHVPVLHAKT
ncbi:potassium-transporting ATPase subunit KdpC [Phenylobacterium montanum]|uniref:Potassium-transporting ATPase KdpC subunit n=1 Tax=Phenylobacterium montanum TaxID=2823693 RepID=A0A975ITN2_9CAUL|nr:potassium-transporting ATPase subunit KdpC [Caulobacter sp. S6]QUD86943.1 potassium-transporting ATPase subunit KdpC [Caulobacter sp. S6]